MHRKVISEGLVLGKRGVGEANTTAAILSQEHGLLWAKAASTRAEKSKLRFGIEPLTIARFSFIRGKYEWKLVGVEKISHELIPASTEARSTAGRIVKLVLRLVHGEEPTKVLYAQLKEGLAYLSSIDSKAELRNAECIVVLRILSALGYVPHLPELKPFMQEEYSATLTEAAAHSRTSLLKAINEALSQSGL